MKKYDSMGKYGTSLKGRADESKGKRKAELMKMDRADKMDYQNAPKEIQDKIKREYRHDKRTKMHQKNRGPLL